MWEVLDRYFSVNGLVKQQLDSFNRFTEQISLVISEYGKFQISIKDQYDVDEKKRNQKNSTSSSSKTRSSGPLSTIRIMTKMRRLTP